MATARIKGVLSPVVTPFKRDLSPDVGRFIAHCKWLLSQDCGLAVFGTNSEANSMSADERMGLLEAAVRQRVEQAGNRPVERLRGHQRRHHPGRRQGGCSARRTFAGWRGAGSAAVSADVLADLEFAWRSVRAVKSNAIILASMTASVGIGMGQVSRVDSARLAVSRAGDRAKGSVAASDAFFPFADGLQILIDAGITAVVQPGGSVRDEEVIAAAQSAGIAMFFTDTRHFSHA